MDPSYGDVDNGYAYKGSRLWEIAVPFSQFALNLKPKYFILKQKENVLSSHLAVLKEKTWIHKTSLGAC